MPSLNKVFLIGNLTKEPELKYIPSGAAVGTLRLACNRKYKAQDGTMKDDTLFINVTVWSKTAENCNEYLSKGSPVFVEGRLQSRTYDGQDGQKKYVTDVVAERVQFLSGGKKKAGGEASDDSIPEEPSGAPAQDAEDKPPF
jgi:single-strand DNA-binding protein